MSKVDKVKDVMSGGDGKERMYDSWDHLFKIRIWGEYPETSVVKFLKNRFPCGKKLRVLDLGCGTGANSWFLAREGHEVFALDGSSEAVRILKDRFVEDGLCVNSFVRDFNEVLPFEDGFFDCVVDVQAVGCCNLKGIGKVYGEVFRVLKSGGWFYSQLFGDMTKKELIRLGNLDFHRTNELELKVLFSDFGSVEIVHRVDKFDDGNVIDEFFAEAQK